MLCVCAHVLAALDVSTSSKRWEVPDFSPGNFFTRDVKACPTLVQRPAEDYANHSNGDIIVTTSQFFSCRWLLSTANRLNSCMFSSANLSSAKVEIFFPSSSSWKLRGFGLSDGEVWPQQERLDVWPHPGEAAIFACCLISSRPRPF